MININDIASVGIVQTTNNEITLVNKMAKDIFPNITISSLDKMCSEKYYKASINNKFRCMKVLENELVDGKLYVIIDIHDEFLEKERADYVLEHTYDGFWDWDLKSNYEYMSPKFWEMFGFDSSEKKPHPDEWRKQLWCKEEEDKANKNAEMHIHSKGKHPFNQVVRYKHKNGSMVHVICRGNVVEWGLDGSPLRFIGTHTDITNQVEQADIIKNVEFQKKIADERLKSRTSLINYIFHEVRNPINVLSTGIEVLEEKIYKVNPDMTVIKNIIVLMKNSVERASEILNDTLDYTRFELKANALDIKTHNLSKITNEAVALSRIKAENLKIDIYTDIDEITNVNIDTNRMFQVINNLLSNSLKFTEENGRIFIKVKNLENKILFSIEDSGCGIELNNIKKIFEPYNNIQSEYTNSSKKGMGIGLSITKKIIELHSSEINVKSTPGKGSTFSFYLPKSYNINLENTSSKTVIKNTIGKKVLIVDDDISNVSVLKELLFIRGFVVETLSDGTHLVEAVKNDRKINDIPVTDFDIILLDNMMKTMDGWEALSIIRSDYDFKQNVIMLSGCTTQDDIDKFTKLGADGVLEKPFNYQKFLKFL